MQKEAVRSTGEQDGTLELVGYVGFRANSFFFFFLSSRPVLADSLWGAEQSQGGRTMLDKDPFGRRRGVKRGACWSHQQACGARAQLCQAQS